MNKRLGQLVALELLVHIRVVRIVVTTVKVVLLIEIEAFVDPCMS